MGLFNLFQKKNKNKVTEYNASRLFTNNATGIRYINKGSNAYRAVGEPMTDEDIEFLKETGCQRTLERQKQREKILNISTRDKEIAVDFAVEYFDEISSFDNRLIDLMNSKQYKEALKHLDEIKKFCKSKGKKGVKYFELYYEKFHNSRNPCFSYKDTILEYIQQEKDYADLYKQIIDTIKSNGSIQQKDLFAMFPNKKQMAISIIKELTDSRIITKEKSGNTYLLSIKH